MDEPSMPFTQFHFGPALGFGLLPKGIWHAPTFIVVNVAVNIEPFLVLFLGLRHLLYGCLHM